MRFMYSFMFADPHLRALMRSCMCANAIQFYFEDIHTAESTKTLHQHGRLSIRALGDICQVEELCIAEYLQSLRVSSMIPHGTQH